MPSGYRKDGTPSGVIFQRGNKKLKNAYSFPKGKSHPKWKDDNVGYVSLHQWVQRKLGKPSLCSDCGTIIAKRFEWANISGKYLRDISDYKRLCVKCHKIFDKHLFLKGEKHPCAKLTEKEVIEIRKLYVPRIYTMEKLAKKFHVDWTTISLIVNRKKWKHI